MDEKEKKHTTPPYVAYKTLKNFLEKFKQGTPGRIDRDLMGTMSGAAQSQVTTALKYLGFISDNNIPTDVMKAFVVSQGDKRKELLKAIIFKAYPYIFNDGFNLTTATSSLLREEFAKKTGATGETITRCMAFLKDASIDAGIVVSQYITQKKPRGSIQRNGKRAPRRVNDQGDDGTNAAPILPPPASENKMPPIEAQNSLLLWGLFQRLPKPGTVWPKEQRDQWTQTLNNVLGLEYKD